MNRRTFLCGLTLGTLFAPLAAGAQPGKVHRIGVLETMSATLNTANLEVAATMWAAFGTLTKLWHVDAIGVTATIAVLSLVTVPVWVPLLPMQLAGARWGMIALQASYMGLLVGVASTYLYTRAIALLGSVRASVFVALVPVVTAFASAPVLAEQPSASEVVGMVVVVLGVMLSLRS